MRKATQLLTLTNCLLLFSGPLYATIPNTDNPTTFLGPTGRFGFTSTLNDMSAASIAGEAGPRNYRMGGTIGVTDFGSNRFKLSAEYLWQKINYAFFSSNAYEWMSQGALGGDYQYLFEDYLYSPGIDINAYVSRAPSKSLGNQVGAYTNSTGIITSYTDIRHIAGSNAYGASPGVTLKPWDGGSLGANAIYDNYRYKTIYTSGQNAKGLGGIIQFNQALNEFIDLGVDAEVRKPFNHYQANLSFTLPTCFGTWLLGLNGAYTIGKNSLPSTYNVGLSADFLLDQTDSMGMTQKQASASFLGWISKPEVHMPQAAAIAEDNVISSP